MPETKSELTVLLDRIEELAQRDPLPLLQELVTAGIFWDVLGRLSVLYPTVKIEIQNGLIRADSLVVGTSGVNWLGSSELAFLVTHLAQIKENDA